MSNMKEANAFEERMTKILGEHGFWASIFPKANDGSQPADIIALNRTYSHLIDAKVCSNGRFVFSRMEDNQLHAMKTFEEKCGGHGWFALLFPEDRIYMVPYRALVELQIMGDKSMSKVPEDLSLEKWLNDYSGI